MNINFHYFTVKTIARRLGIEENDAQTVAYYSEFIDDYDIYKPLTLNNVPEFAQHLAEQTGENTWKFYPVTTGFNSFGDMIRLFDEKLQRLITIPFHFVPRMPLSEYSADTSREQYRTIPTHYTDESIMSDMMVNACARYKRLSIEENVMLIGMLIHTFADTYAHQNFSGFQGWENHSYLEKVTNAFSSKDITGDYDNIIYRNLPSIGHTNIYHAPDDTFVSYNSRMRLRENDSYDYYYGRSNVQEFIAASKSIQNFLSGCFSVPTLSDADWNSFTARLIEGFKITENSYDKVSKLCEKWHALFPEYNYAYNKDLLMANAFTVETNRSNMSESDLITDMLYNPNSEHMENKLTVKTEMFYLYNVFAKQIRDDVNGKDTPIKVASEMLTALQLQQKV